MSVALVLGHSAKRPGAHKRVSEETRQRIIKAAQRLGYRPSRQAQILRGARSETIGMIKTLSNHEVNVRMAREIGLEVEKAGYKLLTAEIVHSTSEIEPDLNAMLDERVEGIIIQGSCAASFHANPKLLSLIKKSGIPVVVLLGPMIKGISCFSPDYQQGMRDLVAHFTSQGCRRLTHISFVNEDWKKSPNPVQWIDHLCIRGFREAALKHKLKPGDIEVLYFPNSAGQSDSELGYAAGAELARRKSLPDALLCRNDLMAFSLIAGLHHAGIRVPDKVKVSGFDNTDIGRFSPTPITSISYPVNELTQEGVSHLIDLIRQKSTKCCQKLFPCTLVPRQSSGF